MKNMKKALALLLCAVLLAANGAFAGFAENALPESGHPYENDFTAEWECGVPGAEGFYLTFSEDTLFEWGALTFTTPRGTSVMSTSNDPSSFSVDVSISSFIFCFSTEVTPCDLQEVTDKIQINIRNDNTRLFTTVILFIIFPIFQGS